MSALNLQDRHTRGGVSRAKKATAGDLENSISPTHAVCEKNFSLSVKATSDLCEDERVQIWHIFEDNMRELYVSSSFGWDPQKKRREMFHPLSRFVIVRNISDSANDLASSGIIAYSMFRFEIEDRQSVVYCYELQVSKESRRFGLGRLLVQTLCDIGAQWNMIKVLLTVFKANYTALTFYKSTGFTIDEMSPDFPGDSEGETEVVECDYSILSRSIP